MIYFLKQRYPELDLRVGTAIRDLVLEPLADLFQDFFSEIQRIKDFLAGKILDEELLETFLKNFLIERKIGAKASGVIRVYVRNLKDYYIPEGTKFYFNQEDYYVTITNFHFPKSKLFLNQLENAYYFLIPVVASEIGTKYNIPKEHVIEPEPFDPDILKAEAFTDIVGGLDKEDIQTFLDRAKQALVVRNLISARSINVQLPEYFQEIIDVTAIGYGDPEMERDFNEIVGTNIGGKADIWIKTIKNPFEVELNVNPDGTLNTEGKYSVLRILENQNSINFTVDKNYSFSSKNKIVINSPGISKVKCLVNEDTLPIQLFMESSDLRPLTIDFLVRNKMPVFLNGTLKVKILPSRLYELEDLNEKLNDWVYKLKSKFSIYELVNFLKEKLDILDVELPIIIEAVLINQNLKEERFLINDEFENRICTFYSNLKLVL